MVDKGNIYLIGSLRNPQIPVIADLLRAEGYIVFDDWYAAGPEADDKWRDYEQGRGHDFPTALKGYAAGHVYEFDLHHLNQADYGVLVLPAGRSGHLELGYLIGRGRHGFILMEGEPERFDVMYKFATGVHFTLSELIQDIGRFTISPKTDTRTRAELAETWHPVDSGSVRLSVKGPRGALRDMWTPTDKDPLSGGPQS